MGYCNKPFQIYVVPSWDCNLLCPHCTVRNKPDTYNEKLFLEQLNKLALQYPDGNFILHGGEPTLHFNRLVTLLNTGIITSITTNCTISNDSVYDIINAHDISTATSWNTHRFLTEDLFLQWLSNIKKLKNTPIVLITLDTDLIKLPIEIFINKLKAMQTAGIQEIVFEPLVDNSKDNAFQDEVDTWLCNITDILHSLPWFKMKNRIEDMILRWDYRCNSITLLPEGIYRAGCILGTDCNKILNECLLCDFAKVCKPCVLHTRCSFYPKFYNKIKNNEA